MSVKTVLVAHRAQAVRDRFAAALVDARHDAVGAESAAALGSALSHAARPVDLVLVDLSLDPGLERSTGAQARLDGLAVPILVFAGSLSSAAEVAALATRGVAGYVNEHAAAPHILPMLAPHLFPDSFNRRSAARVPVTVAISVQSPTGSAVSRTRDVSHGGVAIQTMAPLPVGTIVELLFRLPGSSEDISATGRVAWVDRRSGMGVQFERLAPAAHEVLQGLARA
jgi:uncharacterized protein (TIGR02266 family)